jgi:hypothetical protein
VTDDTTVCSGLATNDEIYLYEEGAAALVSTFLYPDNPGNGVSMEMIDIATGDEESNWQESQCTDGYSPGDDNC